MRLRDVQLGDVDAYVRMRCDPAMTAEYQGRGCGCRGLLIIWIVFIVAIVTDAANNLPDPSAYPT